MIEGATWNRSHNMPLNFVSTARAWLKDELHSSCSFAIGQFFTQKV